MTSRISCDLHDHFEIVCMRQSTVKVTTKNGTSFEGVANTISQQNQQEQLVLSCGTSIELTDVTTLEALNNPIPSHNFKITL